MVKVSSVQEQCSATQEQSASYTTDMSADPPVALKFCDGAIQETAKLQQGHDGFLYANFRDFMKTFPDRPNILLECLAIQKLQKADKKPEVAKKDKDPGAAKKAAGKPKKKKGKAKKKAVDKGPKSAYSIMWYKNSKAIGIREKGGEKRQVVSFGGAACTKTKEVMKNIGKAIAKMLDDGSSFQAGKAEGKRLCSLETPS